jgi:MFS transporter, VNT family, synaptic vesicle glycoprotein 2
MIELENCQNFKISFTGFGKVQIQTIILCGLILMAVLNETLGMGVIIPAAKCDLQLSSVQTGIFSSITYLGK